MAVTDAPWMRAARGALLLDADGTARPTIFAEMSALATATGALNLGQGFPDEDGPAEVLEAAREAIASGVNQYPRDSGCRCCARRSPAISVASGASRSTPIARCS
ncbi:hypothetical protein GCM10025869_25210 [Homoserinibacter gongjuensis]|uniref:Uncharacterized protein n=1 Tax=Homoserinibacter gongjuensis TaxID=1162968 RepID=A0ABQ6JUL4_9MICO|nr:hypothetical protein GCM10025869_25210 [Homoserinibacter gongjuensis]